MTPSTLRHSNVRNCASIGEDTIVLDNCVWHLFNIVCCVEIIFSN